MTIVQIQNLSFSYTSDKTVLNDINIEIEEHEKIGLIGSNGVGKSTLLKLLVGIVELPKESRNKIHISSLELTQKNLKEIRKNVGYIFQDSDSQLFMPTVYADVSFGCENYGYDQEEVQKRTKNALEQVHLENLAQRQIYHLSGGEKKLVAIAGILTLEPQIMLMDEPSAALDPKNRRNLIHILNDLSCAKLIASHDLDFIYDTCDRVILLHQGKVKADGLTKEILQDKKLLESCDLELPLRFQ